MALGSINVPSVTRAELDTLADKKADKTVATQSAAGLLSSSDKQRLDGLRGVRYGTEVPSDLQEGELFVQIVNEA